MYVYVYVYVFVLIADIYTSFMAVPVLKLSQSCHCDFQVGILISKLTKTENKKKQQTFAAFPQSAGTKKNKTKRWIRKMRRERERAETYGAMASAMLHVHMLGLVGSQFILCPEAQT